MKQIITASFMLLYASNAWAQLSFPNGKDSTFMIHNEFADVLFRYKNEGASAVNVKWEKLSATVATGWDLGFCNNGECLPGLPDSGTFSGLAPGEIGFLKIHTSTYRKAGVTDVLYLIYTDGNRAQADTFNYHIVCEPWAVCNGELCAPQDAVIQKGRNISVTCVEPSRVAVINVKGELQLVTTTAHTHELQLEALESGVYVIVTESATSSYSKKVMLF
jgi:hypothetical protein